jgi:3-hydroxypropanoate dehydrogenase
MHQPLSGEALDQIFRRARTYNGWLEKPVTDDTLRQIYDLMKWGPTSANISAARILFLRTPEAKQRLVPALSPGNVDKTDTSARYRDHRYDLCFHDKLLKLFPHNLKMRDLFAGSPELAEATAKRNSSLQSAYLIIAGRALGLDCGPMSGFDDAKVDHEFFGAGREEHGCDQEFFPTTHVRSNFLCNIGYGDPAKLSSRNPRLDFE